MKTLGCNFGTKTWTLTLNEDGKLYLRETKTTEEWDTTYCEPVATLKEEPPVELSKFEAVDLLLDADLQTSDGVAWIDSIVAEHAKAAKDDPLAALTGDEDSQTPSFLGDEIRAVYLNERGLLESVKVPAYGTIPANSMLLLHAGDELIAASIPSASRKRVRGYRLTPIEGQNQ